MALFENLKKKFTRPLIGLGLIGVSTTLAACYGPPPKQESETINEDYCEAILVQACKDDTVNIPENCAVSPEQMKLLCDAQSAENQ